MIGADLFGDREAQALLKEIGEQAPFAMALALTKTAKDVQQAEKGHLRGALDNPIAWTVNSVRVKTATKRDLEAYIWITDEAVKGTSPQAYLTPQLGGGQRKAKRHEVALRNKGILPNGWYTVPGKDARLNKAGNLSAATYVKILTALKAHSEAGFQANRTDSKRSQRKGRTARYFVMKKGGQNVGIYQRTGKRTIKSILHFVSDTPDYTQRLHFAAVAEKVIERRGRQHVLEAIEHAVKTSREKSARTTRIGRMPLRSARVW